MRDDIMDLVLLIVMLGITISVGFVGIVKERKDTEPVRQEYLQDKNTGTLPGYDIPSYGSFDGTLSGADLVLMTQIQDYYMPLPKKIRVAELNSSNEVVQKGDLDITSTYEAELAEYATLMKGFIGAEGYKNHYDMIFDDWKNLESNVDDSYTFTKLKKEKEIIK